jgi:MFS family permease
MSVVLYSTVLPQEFGWSHTQVSIAFSLRGLEMGILAPIMGFLVDRFGSRKLIFSGTFIVGFSLILLGLTNSLLMFYSAFIFLALGASGCASTVLMTAVAYWFRRNVGKAMGIVACGFGAGGILIPLIVWLIDLYQWRTRHCLSLGWECGHWEFLYPLSFAIDRNNMATRLMAKSRPSRAPSMETWTGKKGPLRKLSKVETFGR